MPHSFDSLAPRTALVEVARDFHVRGWMPGTAGNLSARVDANHFWITASGLPKGRLKEEDFLLVRIDDGGIAEQARAGAKASAETAIHRVIYRLFPDVGACLHGHTVPACRAGMRARARATALALPPLEMIKGFDVWQQKPKVSLPLFENWLDVNRIARDVDKRFGRQAPPITALLVRAHGPTVWGRSVQQAYDRFETLDFLLTFLAAGAR